MIGQNDARLKKNQSKAEEESKKKEQEGSQVIREVYVPLFPEETLPSS